MAEENFSLPHDTDQEGALLGTLVSVGGGKTLDRVLEIIREGDFYDPADRAIFHAIISARDKRDAVDRKIVETYLESENPKEAKSYIRRLSEVMEQATISRNALGYAKGIKDLSLRRRAFVAGQELSQDAVDNSRDVWGVIENHSAALSALYGDNSNVEEVTLGDELYGLFDRINSVSEGESDEDSVIPTGFARFDEACNGGLSPGDYVIIAARPSIGKTAFGVSMVLNMMRKRRNVAFFSLEMPKEAVAKRIMSILTGRPAKLISRLRLKKEDRDEMFRIMCDIDDMVKRVIIVDAPNMQLGSLKAKARQLVTTKDVNCIVIDYIGIISLIGDQNLKADTPRFEQIAYISRTLKSLARELKIPFVVLCQVNRDSEEREPMLSNLRDSGSIEQDADVVAFLHRKRNPEKNGKDDDFPLDVTDAEHTKGLLPTKLIIAKNRNGETGFSFVGFRPETTEFVNVIDSPSQT